MYLRGVANGLRDTADEMCHRYGVDDPLHSYHSPGVAEQIRDWGEFVEQVARPLVDGEADDQDAMRLYRRTSPYYICSAMVSMANRLKAAGDAETPGGE